MHLSCSPSLARRVVHGTKVQGPPQARKAKGKGHQPMHHQPICMHQPTKSARVPARFVPQVVPMLGTAMTQLYSL